MIVVVVVDVGSYFVVGIVVEDCIGVVELVVVEQLEQLEDDLL